MSLTYHQETLLAMELDGRHVGKLVQIITESWSMTGTLTRVDQHDNREWGIDFANASLVPRSGEIYTVLHIGPWEGRVIGNQPVTVETAKGTLEAPERAALRVPPSVRFYAEDADVEEAREFRTLIEGRLEEAIEGTIVDDPPAAREELTDRLAREVADGERTINGARAALGFPPLEDGDPSWPCPDCGGSTFDHAAGCNND